MEPQHALEILESLRPRSGGVSSVLAVTRDAAKMSLSSDTDPTEWAVIAAFAGVHFAVTVTGDHVHLILDDDATDDEIRSYLAHLVDIGVEYLSELPAPTVTRWGRSGVTVTVDGAQVRLCGPARRQLRSRLRELPVHAVDALRRHPSPGAGH